MQSAATRTRERMAQPCDSPTLASESARDARKKKLPVTIDGHVLFQALSEQRPMNTALYLQRQGWRGQGHSLDDSNRGLAKPLLVSHKSDSAGLGTKQNDYSNQWWLKAWDKKSGDSTGVIAPPPTTGFAIARNPECLYNYFVKAKPLEGTLTDRIADMSKSKDPEASQGKQASGYQTSKPSKDSTPTIQEKSKKRKHDDDAERDVKDKKAKKKDKQKKVESNETEVAAPPAPSPAFFIDTVGDSTALARNTNPDDDRVIHKSERPKDNKAQATLEQPRRSTDDPAPRPNGEGLMHMHPDRLKLSDMAQKTQTIKTNIAPIYKKKYKTAQTAHFPDPSLSIAEMVKRYNAQQQIPGSDGRLQKRRAPRNIRKEARAAKQAYENAKAEERGERAAPVSIPMSKSERRYAKKNKKPPTERKMLKIQRKAKKQEAARQGLAKRKEIEEEALRMVEEMKTNGTLPDTSKPLEEILEEKRAQLAESMELESTREAAKQEVEKLKTKGKMPLDKTEAEIFEDHFAQIKEIREAKARAKAEGNPMPAPPSKSKGLDYSDVELPELEVPKFKTVTLGIPIPGTKKRGSLKQLRDALVEAGLSKIQQAAYIAKALQDRKLAREEKDKIKAERRKARKQIRGRKKVERQQGLAEARRMQKTKEKEERLAREDPEKYEKQMKKLKKKSKSHDILNHNTKIVLEQRRAEKIQQGEDAGEVSKLDVKQARRSARKLVRLAKKGRLSQSDVPSEFKLKRSQALKLRGNGGRIPDWTAMDIAENIRTAREEAISAAERSNKDRKQSKEDKKDQKVKGQTRHVDDLASGAGYVPLS